MEMDKTTQALLYLMRCALQNEKPQAIDGLDYDALYRLSAAHSVVAMTAMALESGGLLTEEYANAACIKKWKDAKVKAIRKNILLDTEREQILQYFEEQGIWYMPLKGSVLKDLYPRMGMRQMADNDILFDPVYQHQVKAYMESRGYEAISFAIGNHDVYEKPPVYNFELHTSLFNEYLYEEWAAHYENIRIRLNKDPNNGYGYHFGDEDFYVYFLCHGYKHYCISGTGIRFLADIYVFLREKSDSMDWEYVKRELDKLKIYEFETATRELAEKLFGADNYDLAAEEEKILGYLMGSGTYGTMENRVNRELDEIQKSEGPVTGWTKFRYTWKRLFPDKEFMKAYRPFLREHEWAIPFFWIYRIVRGVILRGKQIRRELHIINKTE